MRVYCPGQKEYLEIASEPLVPPGGEGQIFLLPGRPESVAKIFTAPESDHRREKVEALIQHPLRDPPADDGHRRFAMPKEVLLESPGGAFLGYTMARIPNAATLDEFFDPKGSRYFEGGLPFRVGLAISVAELVSEIHRHHLMLVLGDMKPRNILADALGRVSYVDLDSLQLTTRSGVTYLCPVRTEFYTAPEVIDKDVRREKREASSDLYALAVIIFQLLFDGWHPYAGQSTTPLAERIRSGALPVTLGGRYLPPPTAPPFEALPKEVRKLFARAFIDGHSEPRARPTGEEWCEELLRHRESLGRFSKEVPPVAVELAAAAAARTAWTRRQRRSVMTLGAASLLATVAISVACDNLGEEENGEETVAAGVVLPAPPSGDGVPRVSPITSPVLPKHIRARLKELEDETDRLVVRMDQCIPEEIPTVAEEEKFFTYMENLFREGDKISADTKKLHDLAFEVRGYLERTPTNDIHEQCKRLDLCATLLDPDRGRDEGLRSCYLSWRDSHSGADRDRLTRLLEKLPEERKQSANELYAWQVRQFGEPAIPRDHWRWFTGNEEPKAKKEKERLGFKGSDKRVLRGVIFLGVSFLPQAVFMLLLRGVTRFHKLWNK